MSYRIEWHPDTLRSFATDWETLRSDRQRAVMDALDGIDHQLKSHPMQAGESRISESDRVLVLPPVVVAYKVDVCQQLVRILYARAFWKGK